MLRELALFPLQIVVFPGESVNLHIFEPRYRQLVADCQGKGHTFGIPPYHNGRILEYGTELRLVEIVKTYPQGEMDIRTQGMGIFRIKEFFPKLHDRLYAGGLVEDIIHDDYED
ncbi:MAG: peptidase, partial [Bacteroidetes bacterium]